MNKIYTLKITMKYLPKLYRIVEMTETSSVAKIAYTVLSSFNTAMYHLYDIKYKGGTYSCAIGEYDIGEKSENATLTKICDLKLKVGDKLQMTYDFGCDQEFEIEVLKVSKKSNCIKSDYPQIIEGFGKGIVEDIHVSELEEIVNKKETVTCLNIEGYEEYEFENYDIDEDNLFLAERLYKAITAYEELDN